MLKKNQKNLILAFLTLTAAMVCIPIEAYREMSHHAHQVNTIDRVMSEQEKALHQELQDINDLKLNVSAPATAQGKWPQDLASIESTLRLEKHNALLRQARDTSNASAAQLSNGYADMLKKVNQLKIAKNELEKNLFRKELIEMLDAHQDALDIDIQRLRDAKVDQIAELNTKAQEKGRFLLAAALICPLLIALLIYRIYLSEKKNLGSSPDELISHIENLIEGNFESDNPAPHADDHTLLGALHRLRHQLNDTTDQLLQSFNALGAQGITGEQIAVQTLSGKWAQVAEGYNRMSFEIRIRVLGTIRIINAVAQGVQKETAMTLAQGDFKTLQDSLAHMITTFQKNIKSSRNEIWIRTELVRFLDGFQNTKTVQEGCVFLLQHLESLLNFEHGIVWTVDSVDGEDFLTPRTQMMHSVTQDANVHASRAHGLLQKCMAQKSILTLHDLPHDYIKIGSGLGHTSPNSLTLIPICYNHRVLALVEIASLQPIQELHLFLCEQMSNFMGAAFNNIQTHGANLQLLDESKKMGESLENYKNHLEHTNKELTLKSDLVEKVSQYKSEFLANMSHELRTPMGAISGMTYLALQEQVSPKQRNYLNKINLASKHLISILNDILDSSKIEAGKIELERSEFNLSAVLSHLDTVLDVRAKEKGLGFQIHIAPDVPERLVGDALRLGQVLLNLGGNAIKFTNTGHVRVDVKSLMQGDLPNHVTLDFSISDTGIGMTPEQLTGLFQPFQQADSSISRKYGGTGLGLSISSSLVAQMGGLIEVSSTFGQGSVFNFQLDLEIMDIDEASTLNLGGRDLRILCVQSDAVLREQLAQLIQSYGFKVQTASSHSAAMDLVRQSAPAFDLVIAQVVEQGEDGVALAEQFQTSRPAGSASPFIALTDASEHATRRALEKMGLYCAGILENPIDRIKLHNLIFAILSQDSEGNDPANPRNASLASLQGKHILLVEDNDLNQELIRELVESVGVEVTIAHNGAHALEVLSGRAPAAMFDLVLMDCNMPVMDGFQATQAIRKTPALAHLPIIALTANAIKGTRDLVINSGMNDYLTKPLEMDKFYAAMQKWSTQTNSPAQAEPSPLPAALPANVQLSVALSHCMGNRTLLARMMGLFVKNEADFADKFEAAQAAHDATTMIRLAHTLKGGAETVGAMQLAAAAAELEAGCKQGADGEVLSQQCQTTVDKLKIALHELTDLQKSLSAPA